MRQHINFVDPRKSLEQIRLGNKLRRESSSLFSVNFRSEIDIREMTAIWSGWIFVLTVVAAAMTTPVNESPFPLRIIHTNDMHSRFEQISKYGGKCTDNDVKWNNCYGGFPRLLTAVKQQREKAAVEGVPLLFLNAGDSYQGTAWYTVHKWKVVSELMNLLPMDAMSLGNHEFDDGVDGLVPFLNASKIPVVTCNLGLDEEPKLAKSPLKPSMIFNVTGRLVGVIGYLTPETMALSHTEKVKIYDEIGNITTEAKRMKKEGVEIVVALGHSGFETDLRIAKEVPYVDVVIGGHTNTFLYTGNPPDAEIPANLYPVIVTQQSGRKVAVVQAYAYTKYLGILDLQFDGAGELIAATGNPQLLNYEVAEDPDMLTAMEPWREAVVNLTKKKLGKTKVLLDGNCRFTECNLGNLIADAFIHFGVKNHVGSGWAKAPIAFQQAGGIRTSIDASQKDGYVTMEDMIITMPFANPLEVVALKGKYLLEALEWSVARYDPHFNIGRGEFLQFSGLQVTYNLAEPPGSRVESAMARCGDCAIPKMSPIQNELTYYLIMPSFLAKGGDNYTMIHKYGRSIVCYDKMDTDIVAEFIEEMKLIYPDVQNRINFKLNVTKKPLSNGSHRVELMSVLLLLSPILRHLFR